MKYRLALLASVAIATISTAGHATVALTISDTTGQVLGNPPFTLGWQFTANSNVNVTALGIFDDELDGLAESHAVGLWNSAGTLLASTTIGAGTSGTLVNQFRYSNIGAVSLMAGQNYQIGAFYGSGADPLLFSANNVATDAALTYLNGTFAGGGSLANPTANAGSNLYFGPNFMFSAVPEPATWMMLVVGFGLIGAAMRRKRERVQVSFG